MQSCYRKGTKKALAIVGILLAVAISAWIINLPPAEEVQQQAEPKTKYEIGPPDAQEMLELVNIDQHPLP